MKIKTDIYINTVLNQAARLMTFCIMVIFIMVMAGTANAQGLQTISPEQAKQLIQKEKDNTYFTIIDIRTPVEFESGHIKNAALIDLKYLDKKSLIVLMYKTEHRRKLRGLS